VSLSRTLPAESLDVVFKVGERLDEQVPGSGLGLPIVRDLVELYGGGNRLENRPRGGLRATLELPRASSTPHGWARRPLKEHGGH
jgi:signal transduction histidine kinase